MTICLRRAGLARTCAQHCGLNPTCCCCPLLYILASSTTTFHSCSRSSHRSLALFVVLHLVLVPLSETLSRAAVLDWCARLASERLILGDSLVESSPSRSLEEALHRARATRTTIQLRPWPC